MSRHLLIYLCRRDEEVHYLQFLEKGFAWILGNIVLPRILFGLASRGTIRAITLYYVDGIITVSLFTRQIKVIKMLHVLNVKYFNSVLNLLNSDRCIVSDTHLIWTLIAPGSYYRLLIPICKNIHLLIKQYYVRFPNVVKWYC